MDRGTDIANKDAPRKEKGVSSPGRRPLKRGGIQGVEKCEFAGMLEGEASIQNRQSKKIRRKKFYRGGKTKKNGGVRVPPPGKYKRLWGGGGGGATDFVR